MNKVTFREFVGLVFDTIINLEDELKVGCRPSLVESHRYSYATILGLVRNNGRPYIPSK